MKIRAKHEWRQLKASHRGGQAMVTTGFALIVAFGVRVQRSEDVGLFILAGGFGLGLVFVGWIVARRASSRMSKVAAERPIPAP